jgi:hypothetical protein
MIISRWVVGVVLLFGILLMTLPNRDPQSLSRIGSASMLACTKDLRRQIEPQVLRGDAVALTFANSCPELIASLEISEEGGMVISGNRHKLTMQLTPVVEGNKVRWRCRGEPPEAVTRLCKP